MQTYKETMTYATEYICGLRYKLCMMGILLNSPTYVFGNNKSVVCYITTTISCLKKKSSSIAYHFVQEGFARDKWRATYINTLENRADLLTKPLGAGAKRKKFCRILLHYIYTN